MFRVLGLGLSAQGLGFRTCFDYLPVVREWRIECLYVAVRELHLSYHNMGI